MGSRGPQPGWKKNAAPASAEAAPIKAESPAESPVAVKAKPARKLAVRAPKTVPTVVAAPVETPRVSAADRENPAKLQGEALRKLAHTRGMARSEILGMSDEKVRVQLKYLAHRQYQTETA